MMTSHLFSEFVDDLGGPWLVTHSHELERFTLLCL